jgi:hypothetical protein
MFQLVTFWAADFADVHRLSILAIATMLLLRKSAKSVAKLWIGFWLRLEAALGCPFAGGEGQIPEFVL